MLYFMYVKCCNIVKLMFMFWKLYYDMLPSCVGWLTADRKCCMKRCLEFENNAFSCVTLVWRPTCWPGLLFLHLVHTLVLFIHFLC